MAMIRLKSGFCHLQLGGVLIQKPSVGLVSRVTVIIFLLQRSYWLALDRMLGHALQVP